MKFFQRRSRSPKTGGEPVETAPVVSGLQTLLDDYLPTPAPPIELPAIPLTAEEKRMLREPLHPRVARILEELHAIKAAAHLAPKSPRIIRFPDRALLEADVAQDETGYWRFVSNPPPDVRLSDGL
jgi:hypothetical protein